MNWPEISNEDFPPRRDDEPSSLRQDIIDELSDHFVCALNRELLKNPDESTAKQRVLNQFGDPIKIACQLWLDAMKEKIMSQRIIIGVSAVMAVCCIAVVGIAWMLFQESQSMNQKMLAQMSAMADRPVPDANTKLDQQFLTQLEVMMQKQIEQADSSSEEMNPVIFQLLEENKEGKPAVAFKGRLVKFEGEKPIYSVDAVSDEMGILDFGKLPWGNYVVGTIKAPWGEFTGMFEISTIPGRKFEQTIVCPANAPKNVPVEFRVDWQDKPMGEDYYLLCDFRSHLSNGPRKVKEYGLSSFQELGDRSWIYLHDLSLESKQNVYLIDVKNNRATPCPLAADGSIENVELEKLVWSPTVEILQGQYRAPMIYLLQKNELSRLAEINSIEPIKAIRFYRNSFEIPEASYELPHAGLIISPFKKLEIEPSMVVNKTPSELKQIHGFLIYPVTKTYSATNTDQPNVWEINIPDLFPINRESGSLSSASL